MTGRSAGRGVEHTRIAVAIATHRRPDGLLALLDSLADSADGAPGFDVIVVDNDPAGSGITALTDAGTYPFGITSVLEPRPGIAAARNRALELAADHDWICFVDDDETVEPTWLERLVAAQRATSADAVTGPVEFHWAVRPPRWVELGGFAIRPGHNDLERCRLAATNNAMFSIPALRSRDVRFDDALGLTGGSDMLLSRSFSDAGGRIVWAEQARVHEVMPPERCTARWSIRRAIRSGNTSALVELALVRDRGPIRRTARRAVLVVGGVARVLTGAAGVLSAPRIVRQARGARAFRVMLRGVGVLGACVQRPVREYAR
ncbi:glycosyltransferase family A protein [Curtobacterium flaccumfaciens]|nr:glycosyltransferase family A protein [Curtobacterium flaccumfaciens]